MVCTNYDVSYGINFICICVRKTKRKHMKAVVRRLCITSACVHLSGKYDIYMYHVIHKQHYVNYVFQDSVHTQIHGVICTWYLSL
jgi:hypothetical protein